MSVATCGVRAARRAPLDADVLGGLSLGVLLVYLGVKAAADSARASAGAAWYRRGARVARSCAPACACPRRAICRVSWYAKPWRRRFFAPQARYRMLCSPEVCERRGFRVRALQSSTSLQLQVCQRCVSELEEDRRGVTPARELCDELRHDVPRALPSAATDVGRAMRTCSRWRPKQQALGERALLRHGARTPATAPVGFESVWNLRKLGVTARARLGVRGRQCSRCSERRLSVPKSHPRGGAFVLALYQSCSAPILGAALSCALRRRAPSSGRAPPARRTL